MLLAMTGRWYFIYRKLHWWSVLLGVVLLLGIPSALLLDSYNRVLRNQSLQETRNSAADLASRIERVRESVLLFGTLVSKTLSYEAENLRISPGMLDLPHLPAGIEGLTVVDTGGQVIHADGAASLATVGENVNSTRFMQSRLQSPDPEIRGLPYTLETAAGESVIFTQILMEGRTSRMLGYAFYIVPRRSFERQFMGTSPIGSAAIVDVTGRVFFASRTSPASSGPLANLDVQKIVAGGRSGNFDWLDPDSGEKYRGGFQLVAGSRLVSLVLKSRHEEAVWLRPLYIALPALVLSAGLLAAALYWRLQTSYWRGRNDLKLQFLERDQSVLDAVAGTPGVYLYQSSDGAVDSYCLRGADAEDKAWTRESLERFTAALEAGHVKRDSMQDRFSLGEEQKSISWRNFGAFGHGRLKRWTIAGYDVSDVEAAQRANVELSHLSILGEMSTGLAHELAQPLNLIGITAANLERLVARQDMATAADKIGRIRQQVERARKIIDHMRIYGRRVDPSGASSVEAALEGMLLVIGEEFRIAGIDIRRNVPAGLPDCRLPLTQLEQILLNLSSNARDAICQNATPGERFVVISARVPPDADGMIEICFEDSGGGFPAGSLGKLFNPFFTTKPAGKGTGLGLSICRSIVLAAEGKITASNGDHGARFVIHIPVSEPAARGVAA